LKVARDLSELRERDVGQVLVGDQGNSLADSGKVGSSERLESVVVETERAVHAFERGDRNGSAESEGQVASPDEVGQVDLEGLVVLGDDHGFRDVAELHGDIINVTVVRDENSVDLLNVDTLERAKSGVLDVDRVGLSDLASEANLLQSRQGVPLDGVDALELGEVDSVETGQVVEYHLAVELFQVVGADLPQVGGSVGDQVTLDLLDTGNGDVIGGAGRDGDVTGEG
jgi:hypothetical protein